MKRLRRTIGGQWRSLAGRRAWALAAGMALLLTSGFSLPAHAASKPAHNHYMQFVPREIFINTWSAQANLYDRNGKLVYHWASKSMSGHSKTVQWGYYSQDSSAWLDMWARTGNGQVYSFLHKNSTCDHVIYFDGQTARDQEKC